MIRCPGRRSVQAILAGGALFLGGPALPLDYTPRQVTSTVLLHSGQPVWSAQVLDFDGDGREVLVLAGHRGAQGPGYCVLDGTVPCRLNRFLNVAPDRHYCAAGDVDADGDADLYCTSGADRGRGSGPNELWRNEGDMRFVSIAGAGGADDPASRGRIARFFHFNGDRYPDLVSTVWGGRPDDGDNRSKVWLNVGDGFQELSDVLPISFGGRCLDVGDTNGDGFEDLIGCPAQTGLRVLLNRRGKGLEAVNLGGRRDWYWDTAFQPDPVAGGGMLVSALGPRRQMSIEFLRFGSDLKTTETRRIPCYQAEVDTDPDVFCGRLLLTDVQGDGHVDVLVSRHLGWRDREQRGDVPDLLLYGPDYRAFSLLPAVEDGAGERLIATRRGVVQINAGKSWAGSVRLIEF